jgi:hypothetical protein
VIVVEERFFMWSDCENHGKVFVPADRVNGQLTTYGLGHDVQSAALDEQRMGGQARPSFRYHSKKYDNRQHRGAGGDLRRSTWANNSRKNDPRASNNGNSAVAEVIVVVIVIAMEERGIYTCAGLQGSLVCSINSVIYEAPSLCFRGVVVVYQLGLYAGLSACKHHADDVCTPFRSQQSSSHHHFAA